VGWGGLDPPGVVFDYAPGRGGIHGEKILEGFYGILQVDGYSGYRRLSRPERRGGQPLVLGQCWSHARREVIKATPGKGSPVAGELLKQIARLYTLEKEIRGQSPAQRQARARLLIEKLKTWIGEQRSRLSRKSPPSPTTGAACACSLKTGASRWTTTRSRTSSVRSP